jgi:hypothetical protein
MAKIVNGRLQLLPNVSALFPTKTTQITRGGPEGDGLPVFLISRVSFGPAEFFAEAVRVQWTDELGLTAFDPEYIEVAEKVLESTVCTPPTQKLKAFPGDWIIWISPA